MQHWLEFRYGREQFRRLAVVGHWTGGKELKWWYWIKIVLPTHTRPLTQVGTHTYTHTHTHTCTHTHTHAHTRTKAKMIALNHALFPSPRRIYVHILSNAGSTMRTVSTSGEERRRWAAVRHAMKFRRSWNTWRMLERTSTPLAWWWVIFVRQPT